MDLVYHYFMCFLILQFVPSIVALVPEFLNKDTLSKDELLIDMPKSIRLIQKNYSLQNAIYSNRVLTIMLFVIESTSALMCSLIAMWYFSGKVGNSFIDLLNANCFEPYLLF